MKGQLDPPVPAPDSLPLVVLLCMAMSALLLPIVQWMLLPVFRIPLPPWSVWVDYIAVRAIGGACVGIALYAFRRLSDGWLRACLHWTAFMLLSQGYVDDFAREPLQRFLSAWVVIGLIVGVTFGTVLHALERRNRRRVTAGV